MYSSTPNIRARRGNTELLLETRRVSVSVNGEQLGSVVLSSSQLQKIWARVAGITIQLKLGDGAMGVGGTSSEIEIARGMTRISLAWWMKPPPEWQDAHLIFDLLAEHLPREITARYDFARSGE